MKGMLLTFGMILLLANQLMAQSVTGRVTDETTGERLPAVTIIVKGTLIGTSTNNEGYYEINVPTLTDTLVVSYVGYRSIEVPINGRSSIDIQIEQLVISGEELVVVGYGVQDRTNLTSSISSVRGADLTRSPAVNVGNSWQAG